MNLTEEQMQNATPKEMRQVFEWVVSHDNPRIPTAEELTALAETKEMWQAAGMPLWGWFLFPQRPSVTDVFPCFAQTLSKHTFPKRPSWEAVADYSKRMAEALHCTQVFIVLDDGEDVIAVMASDDELARVRKESMK